MLYKWEFLKDQEKTTRLSGDLQPFSIFNFHDYREYLSAYYKYKKKLNHRFSYRLFAKMAGYKSSGFYLGIVNGRNTLSDAVLPGFAKALGLDALEIRYFGHMVKYTDAADLGAKQAHFDKMVEMLPPRQKRLTHEQGAYYSDWRNILIRESLAIIDVGADITPLVAMLPAEVSRTQAEASLKQLSMLGLIKKDPRGFWKVVDPVVGVQSGIPPGPVYRFQEKMMNLAAKSLFSLSPAERHISSMTCSLSASGAERVNRKINQFRREIAEILRSDKDECGVYQMNFQFFPLMRKERSNGSG